MRTPCCSNVTVHSQNALLCAIHCNVPPPYQQTPQLFWQLQIITIPAITRHLALSWATWHQSSFSHSLRSHLNNTNCRAMAQAVVAGLLPRKPGLEPVSPTEFRAETVALWPFLPVLIRSPVSASPPNLHTLSLSCHQVYITAETGRVVISHIVPSTSSSSKKTLIFKICECLIFLQFIPPRPSTSMYSCSRKQHGPIPKLLALCALTVTSCSFQRTHAHKHTQQSLLALPYLIPYSRPKSRTTLLVYTIELLLFCGL